MQIKQADIKQLSFHWVSEIVIKMLQLIDKRLLKSLPFKHKTLYIRESQGSLCALSGKSDIFKGGKNTLGKRFHEAAFVVYF